MTEEKRNRIMAAFTVNAVLLIVILFAVVIYQIVEIVIVGNRMRELDMQTREIYYQLSEILDREYNGEELSEEDLANKYIYQLQLEEAYRQGWRMPNDIPSD